MFGNGLESEVEVFDGVHVEIDPDEFLVVEEEAGACGTAVWVGNLKAVAHGTVDIAEKREGEVVFVGEGFLFGNGIHRDSEGADFGGGEFLH